MPKYYSRSITAPQQLFHLRARNRHGSGRIVKGRLTWRWTVRPTPISRLYHARIESNIFGFPSVFIDSPDLRKLCQGRTIPHLYSQDKRRLCLYLPSSGEWGLDKLFATTLVPWTSLWLFFFEEWLWSDEWQGGGLHPEIDADLQFVR